MRVPLCPIVGIGASAGGLDALKALFQNLPVDTGAAFVVIQQLPKRWMTFILYRQSIRRSNILWCLIRWMDLPTST